MCSRSWAFPSTASRSPALPALTSSMTDRARQAASHQSRGRQGNSWQRRGRQDQRRTLPRKQRLPHQPLNRMYCHHGIRPCRRRQPRCISQACHHGRSPFHSSSTACALQQATALQVKSATPSVLLHRNPPGGLPPQLCTHNEDECAVSCGRSHPLDAWRALPQMQSNSLLAADDVGAYVNICVGKVGAEKVISCSTSFS